MIPDWKFQSAEPIHGGEAQCSMFMTVLEWSMIKSANPKSHNEDMTAGQDLVKPAINKRTDLNNTL